MQPSVLQVTTVPSTLWAFFRGLCGYLRSSGFRVHAVASPGPLLDRFAEETGVATRAIAIERRIRPARDCVALARLTALIREIRPQIVHAHTPKAGLLGMLAATLAGAPVRIYHAHGLRYPTCHGATRRLLRRAERLSCSLSDRVLAVAPSLGEQMTRDRLCPAGKLRVPGNGSFCGVDSDGRFDPDRVGQDERLRLRRQLALPADAPVVGFVGRLVRDKGIEELVAAWRLLRADHPRAHLLLVGGTEAEDPIAPAILEELELDPRIRRVGEVLETAPYYRAMDLFVLPSRREGFGMVALEAAAMGLPVVASRIPGLVDAVEDGGTGALVEAADPERLRAALARYLVDPSLRERQGRAGRERARRSFRPLHAWEALLRHYEELLQDRGLLPGGP